MLSCIALCTRPRRQVDSKRIQGRLIAFRGCQRNKVSAAWSYLTPFTSLLSFWWPHFHFSISPRIWPFDCMIDQSIYVFIVTNIFSWLLYIFYAMSCVSGGRGISSIRVFVRLVHSFVVCCPWQFITTSTRQFHADRYLSGSVCNLTLIKSNGCPITIPKLPARPPASNCKPLSFENELKSWYPAIVVVVAKLLVAKQEGDRVSDSPACCLFHCSHVLVVMVVRDYNDTDDFIVSKLGRRWYSMIDE